MIVSGLGSWSRRFRRCFRKKLKFFNVRRQSNSRVSYRNQLTLLISLVFILCVTKQLLINEAQRDDDYSNNNGGGGLLQFALNAIRNKVCYLDGITDVCPVESRPRPPVPDEILFRGASSSWQVLRPSTSVDNNSNSGTSVGSHSAAELLVYSSFYDDRPVLGGERILRTLAIASYNDSSSFFCQVWYSNCKFPVIVQAEVLTVGRNYRINNATYRQLLLSCRLPRDVHQKKNSSSSSSSWPFSLLCSSLLKTVPTHLSITVGDRCAQSTILLKIVNSRRSIRFSDLTTDPGLNTATTPDESLLPVGICVAVAFGSYDVDDLVTWFEVNRLLGVAEINIYNATLTGNRVTRLLEYYARLGVVNIHQIDPPVVDRKSGVTMDTIKVSSPASLNDCMLRNMYRYRYIIVVDFDEVIVPRLHENYIAMMDSIEKHFQSLYQRKEEQLRQKPATTGNTSSATSVSGCAYRAANHHTFTFRNAYFFREYGRWKPKKETSTTIDRSLTTEINIGNATAQLTGKLLTSSKLVSTFDMEQKQRSRLFIDDFRYRAPIDSVGYAPKSFVNPRRCLSVFNHYCYIRFQDDCHPGLAEGGSSKTGVRVGSGGLIGGNILERFADVPTAFGASHHYRSTCPASKKICAERQQKRQIDDSVARFVGSVERRTQRVLEAISAFVSGVESKSSE